MLHRREDDFQRDIAVGSGVLRAVTDLQAAPSPNSLLSLVVKTQQDRVIRIL